MPLTVVRGGKSLQLQMPVPAQRPLLIDVLRGEYPSYFIYGPLVFSRATLESLMTAAPAPRHHALEPADRATSATRPSPQREELVVISSPLFPHALSKGYSNPAGEVVKAVNGTAVKSLAHLVALLRDLKDEYVVIDFDEPPERGPGVPAREAHRGHRGDPHRQRRAFAGLTGHAAGVAAGAAALGRGGRRYSRRRNSIAPRLPAWSVKRRPPLRTPWLCATNSTRFMS